MKLASFASCVADQARVECDAVLLDLVALLLVAELVVDWLDFAVFLVALVWLVFALLLELAVEWT